MGRLKRTGPRKGARRRGQARATLAAPRARRTADGPPKAERCLAPAPARSPALSFLARIVAARFGPRWRVCYSPIGYILRAMVARFVARFAARFLSSRFQPRARIRYSPIGYTLREAPATKNRDPRSAPTVPMRGHPAQRRGIGRHHGHRTPRRAPVRLRRAFLARCPVCGDCGRHTLRLLDGTEPL